MKKLKKYIGNALFILNKYYWRIIFGVVLVIILHMVGKYYYLRSLVDELDNTKVFRVSSVINIDESRINYKREVYIKNELIVSFFSVDSLYNFLVLNMRKSSLDILPSFPRLLKPSDDGYDKEAISICSDNPNYLLTFTPAYLPINEGNKYFISPYLDVESEPIEKGSNDEYSFRSLGFLLTTDNENGFLSVTNLTISGSNPSLKRMTIDMQKYKDSNGNLYAFILYQDEDKDFLSIKEILEKEQRK